MWKKSKCRASSWLHDWRTFRKHQDGILEVCLKCRQMKFFRYDLPSKLYLNYHLRSALQPHHNRYLHEYGKIHLHGTRD